MAESCPEVNNPSSAGMDEVGKLSPCSRSESPDSNCAICLGKLQNTSFTDSCLHQFCFNCLLEWSKVKAECPLCKQAFKSIIHNVRSMEDYDQYDVQQDNPQQNFDNLRISLTRLEHNRPGFRYRTTFTGRRLYSVFEVVHDRLPSFRTQSRVHSYSSNNAPGTSSFRRNIYSNNMWVRRLPDITGRFRECSPEFFLNNPGQVSRLFPWLNRELTVLVTTEEIPVVFNLIMELLPRYHIRSAEFRAALQPYLRDRTEHFQHEFYGFGTSPFDFIGYDRNALYGPSLRYNDPGIYDASSDSSDSDVQIVGEVLRDRSGFVRPIVPLPTCSATGASTQVSTILNTDSSDDSSDCQVIGVNVRQVIPTETITIDSSDSDVVTSNQNGETSNQNQLIIIKEETNNLAIGGSSNTIGGSHSKKNKNKNVKPRLLDISLPSTSRGVRFSVSEHTSEEEFDSHKRRNEKKSKKHKKDKRKPFKSKKKEKSSEHKKKSSSKEKLKSKKKKLSKKIISSTDSSSSDEEIVKSSRKRMQISSDDSENESDFKYSEHCKKQKLSSRLKSVVHVKNKSQNDASSSNSYSDRFSSKSRTSNSLNIKLERQVYNNSSDDSC